jgi:hypothetical protein
MKHDLSKEFGIDVSYIRSKGHNHVVALAMYLQSFSYPISSRRPKHECNSYFLTIVFLIRQEFEGGVLDVYIHMYLTLTIGCFVHFIHLNIPLWGTTIELAYISKQQKNYSQPYNFTDLFYSIKLKH